jgi:phage-related minor tail protein
LREGTLEQGFGLAMEDYFRNAATAMERGQQIFTSVIGNMGAAIDNFVRTGKFAFKDFARSIIQDIIAIQLRAQATQLLGMAFSGFGGKYTPGSSSFVGPMPQGFADGGSPPVGVASLVGERGPELFIPRTAGTIIPNGSLVGAMGGGQTVNYNGPYIASMSAIDTQSATQFLAKNKQTIWAVNQSAQRSLPVSK